MNNATKTAADRINLVHAIGDGGYPGSKAWTAMRKAETALAAFDAAYPEVLAAIQAEHAAKMASGYQD